MSQECKAMKLQSRRITQTGFTLVEIMVAMLIGMLGIIVMLQLFSVSESQKRATSGSGDAQSTGTIALYGLQREIRQAGYGFSDVKLLGCDLTLSAAVTLNAIAPITINSAQNPVGDPSTDTLMLMYGNAHGAPQGETITDTAGATTQYSVGSLPSFVVGDRVVAAPATRTAPCNLVLDTVTAVSATQVGVAPPGSSDASLGTLFNFGATPRVLAYAVRRGNLTVCDYLANDCGAACTNVDGPLGTIVGGTCNGNWVPVSSNIFSLRAEYGRDTSVPMDSVVDVFDQTTPGNACGWAMTGAVRLALVVRNGQFDKTVLTAGAPVWQGSAADATHPVAVPISLASDASWQNYRYKLYETAIPLRNIAWLGVQSGC